MKVISLIVPSYNEEENIIPFFERVCEVFEDFDGRVEVVFVDDGSSDGTYNNIEKICMMNKHNIYVKGISFSRNFGKEAAMLAGLRHSEGDYISFIDADLQQDPLYVKKMAEILDGQPDIDIVAACQKKRIEGKVKVFLKNMFYKTVNRVSSVHFENNVSDFRTFRSSVKDAILSLPETERFSKGIFAWIGFRTKYIDYEVKKREHGSSHWSIIKLFHYAMDGIEGFSSAGLKIAFPLSIIFFIMAVIFVIFREKIPGLIFFAGSVQLLVTGITGNYLGRTYSEVKHRPSYIVRKSCSRDIPKSAIIGTAEKNSIDIRKSA